VALLHLAGERDGGLGVVEAAVKANEKQRELMFSRLKEALGDVSGKKVGILGLSFKPNTNDIREAPSLYMIESLLNEGAKVQAYDPVAIPDMKAVFPKVGYKKDAYETVKGVDALVLMTEWNQFRNLDLARIKSTMKSPNFFDLRNIYAPEKMKELGFNYYCVGRNCIK